VLYFTHRGGVPREEPMKDLMTALREKAEREAAEPNDVQPDDFREVFGYEPSPRRVRLLSESEFD
jgi:hypothetical protein